MQTKFGGCSLTGLEISLHFAFKNGQNFPSCTRISILKTFQSIAISHEQKKSKKDSHIFLIKFDSLYYLMPSNTLVLKLLWECSFETFLMMYHKLLPGAFEKKKEVFYCKQTTLPTAKKVLSLSNTQRESSSSQNRNAGHTHTQRKTTVPSPLTHMHGNSNNYMYIKNPCHPYIYIPIPTST